MTTDADVRIIDRRTAQERTRTFLPGMGKTWLLPFYDAFTRLTGVGGLHRRAVAAAQVAPGQQVLDVGCGTGNLALAVLAAEPTASVTGLDPDGESLGRAARKARRRRLPLTLIQGYADRLPVEDASLDRVVTSLALHHIDAEGRIAFAREGFRSLRPQGRIVVVDFDGSDPIADLEAASRDAGHGAGHDGGHGHARRHLPRIGARAATSRAVTDDGGAAVVALLRAAGFEDAREVDHVDHRLGRMTVVRATRP